MAIKQILTALVNCFKNQKKALILDALGDGLPFPLWARDMRGRGRYIWASDGFETTFQRPATDVVGHTPHEAFSPDIADNYDRTDRFIMEGETLSRIIDAEVGRDNERIKMITKKIPLWDGPEIIGVVGYSLPFNDAEEMFKVNA